MILQTKSLNYLQGNEEYNGIRPVDPRSAFDRARLFRIITVNQIVLTLGEIARLQTRKISSSLLQPFCPHPSGKCRPSLKKVYDL